MESSSRFIRPRPPSPHHHHHHHHFFCHRHRHRHRHYQQCHHYFCIPHKQHHHFCPLHNPYHHHHYDCHAVVRGPELIGSYPLQNDFNLLADVREETSASITQVLQEPGHNALEEEEEEEEEDPIFVLTDEWREFFAKSEAKRKLG
ncbi:hypothetical protein MANES_13G051000v8 [Manihot esculenta]|uniref:Uncharacterized protein n=1 Tax=Manihot esculenta TaxID=3983 RepID=A0ACB7GKD0_MANES|nr:hypothetical protein MANES_13G051000v8 [Manihot esculenta]